MKETQGTENVEPIRKGILYLLLDDAFMLCHVSGALPYDQYPSRTTEQVFDMARKETLNMASAGLISVLECLDPETQHDYVSIPRDHYEEVLLKNENWSVPSENSTKTFWIELTSEGEQILKAMMKA